MRRDARRIDRFSEAGAFYCSTKKEEEEKRVFPLTHVSIHVYTQCNTHGKALLLCAFFPLGKKL